MQNLWNFANYGLDSGCPSEQDYDCRMPLVCPLSPCGRHQNIPSEALSITRNTPMEGQPDRLRSKRMHGCNREQNLIPNTLLFDLKFYTSEAEDVSRGFHHPSPLSMHEKRWQWSCNSEYIAHSQSSKKK